MNFVRSYFFTNETLGSWTLFSSRLDSPVIKTLETHFFTLSECVSNVLITGESNFDEKKCSTAQSFIRKEVTSYKIHTLGHTFFFNRSKYFLDWAKSV